MSSIFDWDEYERMDIARNKPCVFYQARQERQGAGGETVRWEMAAVRQISDYSDIRVNVLPWVDRDISLAHAMDCALKM